MQKNRTYYVVDVEADGPYPPDYSMVSFGAIKVTRALDVTFFGTCQPISYRYRQESLDVCQLTREKTMTFPHPMYALLDFREWIASTTNGVPVFVTDNLSFDWQFMNYYLHTFAGGNPFGYSGMRLNDLWHGLNRNIKARWKHLRKTKHTHHPVDDARGNAEAFIYMIDKFALNVDIPL